MLCPQTYHSLHARGEKVEDVVREAENGAASISDLDNGPIIEHEAVAEEDDMEEGEVDEDEYEDGDAAAAPAQQEEANTQNAHLPASSRLPSIPPLASVPNMVLTGGGDEALKNLMMSWYYAGYYTGLFEGQQKAASGAALPSGEDAKTKST